MKYPVIIKQSPLVLIRRVIQLEFIVGLFLFLLSFVVNYEEFYESSQVGDTLLYDVFLVLGASIAQLMITFIVFLFWFNEEYRLKEKEIVHRRGLIFTREESLMLKNVSSVEYKRSPLELLFGYGTIMLKNPSGETFRIRSIETPEIYADLIKDTVDQALNRKELSTKKLSILDMVLEGEHSRLELKQTFRFDIKKKDVNKMLEKAVMKTVAAFLNSEGGHLIIGVTDNGKVYGLQDDYQTLVRKDRDGFENHFNQVLKTMIGASFRQYVRVEFETVEEKDVCLVEVVPSPKPVYLNANGEEEFFIRTGNTTSPLKVSEVSSYIESHWSK